MNLLASNTSAASTIGLTLSITPGVWLCSHLVRVCASTGGAEVAGFNAYISATGITGVSPSTAAFSAMQFSCNSFATGIGVAGPNNLSVTGTVVITSTTTQTLTLISYVGFSGSVIYVGSQCYIMATRIA